tara:strand:+ start:1975 stop:2601 length:627 start_codon:yes stop_codon:yes gene_type:complete
MEFGQQINENRNNAKLSLFQNQGYQFERKKTKTLLLDVSSDIASAMPDNFSVKLVEPLVIDTLSDIYLDSFTTFNALINTDLTGKNMGFTLKINEFNINSNIGNNLDKTAPDGTTGKKLIDSRKFNTIFIPNSSSITPQTTVLHKSKKFNYICSINPGKLTTLSGSIFDAGSVTSSANVPTYASPFIDAGAIGETSRFIAEFVIISRE